MQIFFLRSYTAKDLSRDMIVTSDTIGYGVSAPATLGESFKQLGHDVTFLPEGTARSRLEWAHLSYRQMAKAAEATPPDVIFIFHILNQFPTEIRRILVELELTVPMMGYTHGSNWDETDAFRQRHFGALKMADLANLLTLDRILLTSQAFRDALSRSIGLFSPTAAEEFASRACIVGCPIDVSSIDLAVARAGRDRCPSRVVFNHSLVPEKGVDDFINFGRLLLSKRLGAEIFFTRAKDSRHSQLNARLDALVADFPDRVHICGNLSQEKYYELLVTSGFQVSTAYHESFGVSSAEAMYAGCCSITPRLPAYLELVQQEGNGVFHDGTPSGILSVMDELLDNPELTQHLAGMQRSAVARFNGTWVARRILEGVV